MSAGNIIANHRYSFQSSWPKVVRDPYAISRLVGSPSLGLDLEWDLYSGKPTILGLSNGALTVSCPWEHGRDEFERLVRQSPATQWAGHNIVSADWFALRDEGVNLPLDRLEDTIIRHWLLNMHLCKTSKKASLGDDSDRRGRGFMNLWTMCSLYTDLRCWKQCRGEHCEGPCPRHDVYGYNGLDSFGPLVANKTMQQKMALRGLDSLYPLHREIAAIMGEMSRIGVPVDVPYVAKLREEFKAAKNVYWNKEAKKGSLPFNPESPKQIKEFFRPLGIHLEDTAEETIRETVEELESAPGPLQALLEYKELGDGVDKWFAPRVWDSDDKEWKGFVWPDGRIRASLGFYTSSGRLMCSGPNLQNISKRRTDRATGERVGKKVRRAIIAPEGCWIFSADWRNAENLVYLHLAGYDSRELVKQIKSGMDFHTMMAEMMGLSDGDEFCVRLGGRREAAKSAVHAIHYLEGLKLIDPAQIKGNPRMREEIRCGARLVFPDWTFQGKVVTFTGINLADRAFGSATRENRIRALNATRAYFSRFPKIRELQQRITRQVEEYKVVMPPHGYQTLSYGYAEDRLKTAASMFGSQPVAHTSKIALKQAWSNRDNLLPILQIHDELLFFADKRHDPRKVKGWIKEAMEIETPEIKGLVLPVDVSYGPNWAEQTGV